MLIQSPDLTEGIYTLSEFIGAIDAPPVNPENANLIKIFKEQFGLDWYGLEKDAAKGEAPDRATLRLIRDGWSRGADLVDEVQSDVTAPPPRSVRRFQRWQSQGDDVEMQRIWAGDLDSAWRGTHRDTRHGPQRVRLLIDAIDSGGADAETMKWRGVAALRLSDLLTEAGYSVQVESVIHCGDWKRDKHKFKLRAIVKEYEQPLDTLTLAACAVLPAFFRSLVHMWGVIASPHPRGDISYFVTSPEESDFPDGDQNARSFLIPRLVTTADAASSKVAEIIRTLDEAGE